MKKIILLMAVVVTGFVCADEPAGSGGWAGFSDLNAQAFLGYSLADNISFSEANLIQILEQIKI